MGWKHSSWYTYHNGFASWLVYAYEFAFGVMYTVTFFFFVFEKLFLPTYEAARMKDKTQAFNEGVEYGKRF